MDGRGEEGRGEEVVVEVTARYKFTQEKNNFVWKVIISIIL